MQFIDLQAQHQRIKDTLQQRFTAIFAHGQYILGSEVEELETALADYVGVRHTIAVANGTDALHLALMALNIGPGDAVFVPAFTFFSSAEAIALSGARPLFVDVQANTFNLCPQSLSQQIEACIREGWGRPRAIIVVDLFGLPADYAIIKPIAKKYDLSIIEDAAQSLGGSIGNQRVGCFGDIATTSFFPSKPLGCYGDGGALFVNDPALNDLLRSLRMHGEGTDHYDHQRIGLNSRLDTLQAAVLLAKLQIFDEELVARAHIAACYREQFMDMPDIIPPACPSGHRSSWSQFTLRSTQRDNIIQQLQANNIPARVYYRRALHLQPAFAHLPTPRLPVAETLQNTVFSLPIHPYLDIVAQDKVIAAVKAAFN